MLTSLNVYSFSLLLLGNDVIRACYPLIGETKLIKPDYTPQGLCRSHGCQQLNTYSSVTVSELNTISSLRGLDTTIPRSTEMIRAGSQSTFLLKRVDWAVLFVMVPGISRALVYNCWLRMTQQEALHLFGKKKIPECLGKPRVRQ